MSTYVPHNDIPNFDARTESAQNALAAFRADNSARRIPTDSAAISIPTRRAFRFADIEADAMARIVKGLREMN